MDDKIDYKEKIIKMVTDLTRDDVLQFLYIVVKDFYEKYTTKKDG